MARRPDNPRPGLLVIDKPQGLTSHDVVSRVRRLAHTRKVGHGGTLDPMATGVLVIGIGKATKLLTWVSGHSKEYRATIRFGVATNTDDAEGVATAAVGCSSLSEEQLEAALAPLRGDIMQVPSTVSAIKVNGKRVNIASYKVKVGDVVEIKEASKQLAFVLEANQLGERDTPDYLEVDHGKETAKVVRVPGLSEVPFPVQMEPHLIIEFYSR